MAEEYKTGIAGNISIGGVVINISKWQGKITRDFADATDSSGFDSTSQNLWKKQAKGATQFEGTIEGFYDFNSGSPNVLAAVVDGTPLAAVFKYDESTAFATGLVNFMDYDSGVEVDGSTTIGFTTSFKSYGVMNLI